MDRTLVIGLDSATWDVIDPLLQAGRLTAIEGLIEDGTRGVLESTVPPMTPVAWTTAVTGVNPGKHGIYDFFEQDRTTYEISSTDYSGLTRPALWDIFNANDRSIGVLNFPLAYPTPPADPFFVSGIPNSVDNDYTHPVGLRDELNGADYRIQPRRKPGADPTAYFRELNELVRKRTDVTIHLLEEYDVELFWTVFMSIDWAQHYLWDTSIDGESAVERLYVAVDEAIDRLLTATGEEWNVLLVSDHGAGRIDHELHLNSLLEEWEYLTTETEESGPLTALKRLPLDAVVETSRRIPVRYKQRLIEALPETVVDKLTEATGTTGEHVGRAITWDETSVFSFGYMGRLFIHTEERYPDGVVPEDEYEEIRSELISRVEDLTHPETGERIVERAVRTERLYDGEYVDEAPDILVIPRAWQCMMYGDFGKSWIHEPEVRIADHDQEGIVVFSGPAFERGTTEAKLEDITPTLLHLHGLPLVADMDGAVKTEALVPEVASRTTPRSVAAESVPRCRATENQDSREEVTERLEDLGYL